MSRPGFELPAKKENGKWTFDKARFQQLAERLKDGAYSFVVERRSKLGVQQRKYYFAVVVPAFSDSWGTDDDDTHELLKEACNKKVVEIVNRQTGEVEEKTIGGSTAGFTTEQWSAFIERCHRFGATDFGFVVPEPDKEYHLHQYEAEQSKGKRHAA